MSTIVPKDSTGNDDWIVNKDGTKSQFQFVQRGDGNNYLQLNNVTSRLGLVGKMIWGGGPTPLVSLKNKTLSVGFLHKLQDEYRNLPLLQREGFMRSLEERCNKAANIIQPQPKEASSRSSWFGGSGWSSSSSSEGPVPPRPSSSASSQTTSTAGAIPSPQSSPVTADNIARSTLSSSPPKPLPASEKKIIGPKLPPHLASESKLAKDSTTTSTSSSSTTCTSSINSTPAQPIVNEALKLQVHRQFDQYEREAKQGSSEAAFSLYQLYRDGAKRTTDSQIEERQWMQEMALQYLKQAAEGRNAAAQYEYAQVFEERNKISDATVWYQYAAAQGNQDAIFALGDLYEQQGDILKALEYYSVLAKAGDTECIEIVTELEAKIAASRGRPAYQESPPSGLGAGRIVSSSSGDEAKTEPQESLNSLNATTSSTSSTTSQSAQTTPLIPERIYESLGPLPHHLEQVELTASRQISDYQTESVDLTQSAAIQDDDRLQAAQRLYEAGDLGTITQFEALAKDRNFARQRSAIEQLISIYESQGKPVQARHWKGHLNALIRREAKYQ